MESWTELAVAGCVAVHRDHADVDRLAPRGRRVGQTGHRDGARQRTGWNDDLHRTVARGVPVLLME